MIVMDGWTKAGRKSIDREVVKILGLGVSACLAVGAAIGVAVDVLLHRHKAKS